MNYMDSIVGIAEAHHQEALHQAETLRLLRQARPHQRGRLSRWVRAPLSRLGHLLLTLGQWLEQRDQPQTISSRQLISDCCSESGERAPWVAL
jgi:hypothetical protein